MLTQKNVCTLCKGKGVVIATKSGEKTTMPCPRCAGSGKGSLRTK